MPALQTSDTSLTATAAGGADGAFTCGTTAGVLSRSRGWLRDASHANPLEVEVVGVGPFSVVLRRVDRAANGVELQTQTYPDLSAYAAGSVLYLPAQVVAVNDTRVEQLVGGDGVTVSGDGTGVVNLASPVSDADYYRARAFAFLGGSRSTHAFHFKDFREGQPEGTGWYDGSAGGTYTVNSDVIGGGIELHSNDSGRAQFVDGYPSGNGFQPQAAAGSNGEWYIAAKFAPRTAFNNSSYCLLAFQKAAAAAGNPLGYFGLAGNQSTAFYSAFFGVGRTFMTTVPTTVDIYHVFECYRKGGTTHFLIDGVEAGSAANCYNDFAGTLSLWVSNGAPGDKVGSFSWAAICGKLDV